MDEMHVPFVGESLAWLKTGYKQTLTIVMNHLEKFVEQGLMFERDSSVYPYHSIVFYSSVSIIVLRLSYTLIASSESEYHQLAW